MTMPHMSNCAHSAEGWCLACVKQQQEHINQLEAKLQDVDRGLDVAERNLAVAVQGKHEDAPFPLDENEAKLWHRAQASAYQHALEMCNSTSLKAFIENGFKPVQNVEPPVPKASKPKP